MFLLKTGGSHSANYHFLSWSLEPRKLLPWNSTLPVIWPVRPSVCFPGGEVTAMLPRSPPHRLWSVPFLPSAPCCVEAPSEGSVCVFFDLNTCFQGDWLESLSFTGSFYIPLFPNPPNETQNFRNTSDNRIRTPTARAHLQLS